MIRVFFGAFAKKVKLGIAYHKRLWHDNHMNSAQHTINQMTLTEVRQAISLGYINYNSLTEEAKRQCDARMTMLLNRRDVLFAQRRKGKK